MDTNNLTTDQDGYYDEAGFYVWRVEKVNYSPQEISEWLDQYQLSKEEKELIIYK